MCYIVSRFKLVLGASARDDFVVVVGGTSRGLRTPPSRAAEEEVAA